jgi:predicted  nucleic acid-binding Zn-ribbon protein
MGEKVVATQLADAEDRLDAATDPAEQARRKEEVERLQGDVSAMKTEEQARASALDDAQAKLRNAEDALDGTQDELNTLIKRLTPAPSTSPSH